MDSLEQLVNRRDDLVERKRLLLLKKRQRAELLRITHTVESHKHSKALISKYSRLPDLDMDRRLRYIQLNCPWMHVEKIEKTVDEEKRSAILNVVLLFDTCGEFELNLKIDISEESILELHITPKKGTNLTGEWDNVIDLINRAEESNDVSSFVYGLNSFLRMRHKRKKTWMSTISEMNLDTVSEINSFSVTAKSSTKKDLFCSMLFDHSPPTLDIRLKSLQCLHISWIITFKSPFPRHCVSDFTATITKGSQTMDVSQLFKSLVEKNDVKIAVLQLSKLI